MIMDLGIRYDQLTPITGDVRVGIVPYDGSPNHVAVLEDALPRYLGSEGAVHGIEYPKEYMDAVIQAANDNDVVINFPVVAKSICAPILTAGLLTEVLTYGVECDDHGNLYIVPYLHAEDTSLDLEIAKEFRAYTRCPMHPNGVGLGTFLVKERMSRLATDDPNWVYGGRENEYAGDNPPIIGLMNKFGATLGTPLDSPVLQINGQMSHLERAGWINVTTEALPADATGLRLSRNNFRTRWASDDGQQEIIMIDTFKRSTFNGAPVAWTKFKSKGKLPKGKDLQHILNDMLIASRDKMDDWQWGTRKNGLKAGVNCPIIPITGSRQEIEAAVHAAQQQGLLNQARIGGGQSHKFGSAVRTRIIHLSQEADIAEALQSAAIKAVPRTFGSKPMLSGVTSVKNVPNPEAMFGQKLPEATKVSSIDPVSEAQMPIFDFLSKPVDFLTQDFSPTRPFEYHNDNPPKAALRAA